MSAIYSPPPAGLEFQVIQYFTTNPEEELTTSDIGEKFGIHPAHVHTRLAKALEAGALKRSTNTEEELVYALGAAPTTVKANAVKHPSLRSGAGRVDQALAGRKPAKTREQMNLPPLTEIPLEEGVPIPAKGGGRMKTDCPALFSRMQPGQSCVLPRRAFATLGKAVTQYTKAGLGEMATRVVSDTELRLWRIK